jgi:hypothetical protein
MVMAGRFPCSENMLREYQDVCGWSVNGRECEKRILPPARKDDTFFAWYHPNTSVIKYWGDEDKNWRSQLTLQGRC